MLREQPYIPAIVRIEIKNFEKVGKKWKNTKAKMFTVYEATHQEVIDVLIPLFDENNEKKEAVKVCLEIKFFPVQKSKNGFRKGAKCKSKTIHGMPFSEVVEIINKALDEAVN